jgi:hypothetical protein
MNRLQVLVNGISVTVDFCYIGSHLEVGFVDGMPAGAMPSDYVAEVREISMDLLGE